MFLGIEIHFIEEIEKIEKIKIIVHFYLNWNGSNSFEFVWELSSADKTDHRNMNLNDM